MSDYPQYPPLSDDFSQHYLGIRHVVAWRCRKEGEDGYAIRHDDSYTTWLPEADFERTYLPLGAKFDLSVPESAVTDMVAGVVFHEVPDPVSSHPRMMLAVASTRTGFLETSAEACSNPAHFSSEVGKELVVDGIHEKIHGHLAFALQWAIAGLKAVSAPGDQV